MSEAPRRRAAVVSAMAATATVVTATVLATAAPAGAAARAGQQPVVVTVRVEGEYGTIFEGPVITTGHTVTTASGGTHLCDGTNGGANPRPGPTAIAALDDASHLAAVKWDAVWLPPVADFGLELVDGSAANAQSEAVWAILVNFQPVTYHGQPDGQLGGCQQELHQGDEVLFAYDWFFKPVPLRLTGPHTARVGVPFTVRVTDGRTGAPAPGAQVDGATTGPDGTATIVPARPGVLRLKAEESSAIRSNRLDVAVS